MKTAFHIHTLHSADGYMSLPVLHARAKACGLQGLIVTDHNTAEGALQFASRYPDFRTVVGEEIYTREGEIIGLFLRQTIPAGLGVEETVAAIRAQGGLVAVPHPFDRRRPSTLRAEALARIENEVDIVEVFNSRTFGDEPDREALEWAQARNKAVLWGTDAHLSDDIGRAVFELPDFSDAPSFLNALRKAQPLLLRRASFWFRARNRLKKTWGAYGPLNLPESLCMGCQRRLFLALGGGFVSIEQVEQYADRLADRVLADGFTPDVVVGLASGGSYPAFRIAERLRVPVTLMRVSHPQIRVGNLDTDDLIGVMFLRNWLYGRAPVVKSGPGLDLAGRKVLMVDDDCTTGDSLAAALNLIKPQAADVRTAVLRLLGESSPRPDYFMENRVGAVLRHPRFPWIRYSPYYRPYWRKLAVCGGEKS
ncbi:MAG TPA: hypothetical protein DCZ95_09380 [Verrucomicrobia bacterium]|nr:hypothetical protein [Verrucomicrobiota bacterium]